MKWIQIQEQHLKQILDWRTSEEITKYMYTDIEYNLENQKNGGKKYETIKMAIIG